MDKELNSKGIFPAPGQADPLFIKKAAFLLELDSSIFQEEGTYLSSFEHPFLTKLDIDPSWIFCIRSDRNLRLWEGGCLWQKAVGDFTIPIIQIAKKMKRSYPEEELLLHEMIHAVRSDFKETRFEEMLAYQSSVKSWRRYFGAFFRTPKEIWFFLLGLSVTFFLQMMEIATAWMQGFFLFPWFLILALLVGGVRLKRDHLVFNRALENLSWMISTPGKELAVAIRLSDSEIAFFAEMTKEEALCFIE
ncbi:MAG: hypothetical protein HYZ48_01765, partial [Chlamydiales bacterium]|nr:hypothetical protein [Chlamydiales bacterium]